MIILWVFLWNCCDCVQNVVLQNIVQHFETSFEIMFKTELQFQNIVQQLYVYNIGGGGDGSRSSKGLDGILQNTLAALSHTSLYAPILPPSPTFP